MIEVDPANIDGDWRFADDEEPEIGPVFTLRNGQVFEEGRAVGVYAIHNGVLTFSKTRRGADDRIWTTEFSFDLTDSVARHPDRVPGYWKQVATDDFDKEIVVEGDGTFYRIS